MNTKKSQPAHPAEEYFFADLKRSMVISAVILSAIVLIYAVMSQGGFDSMVRSGLDQRDLSYQIP